MAKNGDDGRKNATTDPLGDLPARKKLPESIQQTLDSEEKLWEVLYDGNAAPSTESNLRYMGYAARLRTIMLSAHRYVAYTSDIGESFRPVAHPWLVRSAYGISWAYIAGDVGYEGYKAYIHNKQTRNPELYAGGEKLGQAAATPSSGGTVGSSSAAGVDGGSGSLGSAVLPQKVHPLDDYRTVMAQRAIFQSLASMGLPAVTIHSIVKYSGKAMKDFKSKPVRTWGPIGLGLAAVPFLPYMFDKPIEHAVEWTFHKGFELAGAVPPPSKEKEL